MANSNAEVADKRVIDVNVFAIFLVTGHPGFDSVSSVVESGLRGAYTPVILDIVPMRALWIMTKRWGLQEKDCRVSIEYFLNTYDTPCYLGLKREAIQEGFRLADELKHDVFDCMYLALALQENATGIVTTDTDFEKLCSKKGLDYINPVPKSILKRFKEQNI